jgi:protein O-GlcNAc transferase
VSTESVAAMREAALAAPSNPQVWLAYAQASANVQAWVDAERGFAHLHTLVPTHAMVLRNWLRTLERLGRADEALVIAKRWLAQSPADVSMWMRVVTLAQAAGHAEDEIAALQQLRTLEPTQPAHAARQVRALKNTGAVNEAAALHAAARAQWPDDLWLLWLGATMVHPIPQDAAQIHADRKACAEAIATLSTYAGNFDHAIEAVSRSHFYFAYHGKNERDRAHAVATQIIRHLQAAGAIGNFPLVRPPLANRRIRIVFASSFWQQHTISRYFGGWIRHFDRAQFEVALAHDGEKRDATTQALSRVVDATLRPSENQSYARAISDWQPDVIIYTDVGMVGKHMPLIAQRIAPLQIAAWGHPVTTGFPTVDAYISVAAMEPDDWRAHYSERDVVLLPGIGVHFTPPALPTPETRETLSLPTDDPLLVCPQSLFKIHPDDEALFVDVLSALPKAKLILFAVANAKDTRRFIERLSATMTRKEIALDRLIVLPQMAHAQFLQVLMACDAVLDTRHFSGGNTSLDALASGLPIVTWPGAYMRGRQTAGMLRLIGETDDIVDSADGYIARVKALIATPAQSIATERQLRREKSQRLFNDFSPVRALEQAIIAHLQTAHAQHRTDA